MSGKKAVSPDEMHNLTDISGKSGTFPDDNGKIGWSRQDAWVDAKKADPSKVSLSIVCQGCSRTSPARCSAPELQEHGLQYLPYSS